MYVCMYMFNTRNESGISAHPCIILYIIIHTRIHVKGKGKLPFYKCSDIQFRILANRLLYVYTVSLRGGGEVIFSQSYTPHVAKTILHCNFASVLNITTVLCSQCLVVLRFLS
jgi:hypothetical protein